MSGKLKKSNGLITGNEERRVEKLLNAPLVYFAIQLAYFLSETLSAKH
ncbi:hypothetical protein Krac_8411 [Ktedonobacter racemifer DSM 44963]|uniref:Uncharacterized protein n=1 Tax=Ktedonobacter racemifer DSM 44963 TaxID=485913 RepID=D6TMT7_KTERA|nr:hypothetical protein Krac_8411 [Ktedonobacter racemifer DSM 44963]